jgi:hypothetical protein
MRAYVLGICSFLLAAGGVEAQVPRSADSNRAVDATIGNKVLQLRYLTRSPLGAAKSDLDYGLLVTENNDLIGSAALMFETDLDQVPRLRFEIGPQAYLARLVTQQKTDVFALAAGANARYDIIRRLGLAAVGSAFYSPGVLTFGSAHNLYDFTAGVELRFASRLTGMAGYRWMKFTLVNQPDIKVTNELFAGLRWRLD